MRYCIAWNLQTHKHLIRLTVPAAFSFHSWASPWSSSAQAITRKRLHHKMLCGRLSGGRNSIMFVDLLTASTARLMTIISFSTAATTKIYPSTLQFINTVKRLRIRGMQMESASAVLSRYPHLFSHCGVLRRSLADDVLSSAEARMA